MLTAWLMRGWSVQVLPVSSHWEINILFLSLPTMSWKDVTVKPFESSQEWKSSKH